MNGKFIMVDGITGSGKSTVFRFLQEMLRCNKSVVTKDWYKTHNRPPRFSDFAEEQILFTCEPTYWWVGASIRDELSHHPDRYFAPLLAQAFSLDRYLQYQTLILPALEAGKTIIQERGFTSSVIIQPIMKHGPTLEDLLALPGNALALENPPDHFIFLDLDPEVAVDRLKLRDSENKGVFEQTDILRATAERFRAPWFRELLTSRGTKIHTLNANQPLDMIKTDLFGIMKEIFPL